MPAIDFDSLVPIGAGDFQLSLMGFMGLGVVGAILVFKIGMALGPALMRSLMGVVSRPGSLDDDSQVQMFNEFIAERMAERAASREYYGERWASGLNDLRSRGDISGLTDLWENEMDRRSRDEFEAWLEENTGSRAESWAIVEQIEAEGDARFRAAMNPRSFGQRMYDSAMEGPIPHKELDGIAPAGVHTRDDLDFALYSGFDHDGESEEFERDFEEV